MRGYPHFSLCIPIALSKIYLFCMFLIWRKKTLYLVGSVLKGAQIKVFLNCVRLTKITFEVKEA